MQTKIIYSPIKLVCGITLNLSHSNYYVKECFGNYYLLVKLQQNKTNSNVVNSIKDPYKKYVDV